MLFPDPRSNTYNHSLEHDRSFGAPFVPADVVFLLPISLTNPFPAQGLAIICSPPSGAAAPSAAWPRKEDTTMASLTSLQGNGGGRIPMGSFSYAVSRHELAAIIAAMPSETCRAMHHATREGDLTTAQHLLREAAERYLTSTPAAPAVQPPAPRSGARRSGRTQTNERS